jgi:hypothetical protein
VLHSNQITLLGIYSNHLELDYRRREVLAESSLRVTSCAIAKWSRTIYTVAIQVITTAMKLIRATASIAKRAARKGCVT